MDKVKNFFQRTPLVVWFIVPSIIILGVGVWFFSNSEPTMEEKALTEKRPEAVSTPVEGAQDFDIVGRNHITQGTPGSGYISNPPSSGPHWPSPAKNGVYDNSLPDEKIIHSMEHGYVWISYKSDVPDEVKNKLKEIVKSDDWKVVLEPRDKNDAPIALAAWGRVLNMNELDENKVKEFIKTYRNRGPEKTPD